MILKFKTPIPIQQARQLYNDTVKFISTTKSYPNVEALEFDSDPRLIFKRKAVDPKVSVKTDKILNRYEKKIQRIWNRSFKQIEQVLQGPSKQEKVTVTEEQRQQVRNVLDSMQEDLAEVAYKPYKDAFRLGKLRGQIISGQELDDDLTGDDEDVISARLDDNEQYLVAFSNDLKTDLDKIMETPYESYDELAAAVRDEVHKPKKSRVLSYVFAALGLIAAGMVTALKQAKEEEGHFRPSGGYWTLHPEEGAGGPVCDGCEANAGVLFTLEEFEAEYQHNDCLTRCRCTLEFLKE